jgi:hypothetical protein
VAIKWIIETQILEGELKEVGELNSVLLNEKQELKTKLAEESQAKDGNHFPDSFFRNWIMSEWTLNWPLPRFAVYRDQFMALGVVPSDLDSATKDFADLKAELDKERAAWIAG